MISPTDIAPALDAAMAALDSGALTAHILARYHETHRRELPEVIVLAQKVERVHGTHPAAPCGLADLLLHMQADLTLHMRKEELILFPAMAAHPEAALDAPLLHMRGDHEDHISQLRHLARLTHDFTLPEGACRSWQALYAGLAKLHEDLIAHIHIENQILFLRYEAEA